ncbi:MAG TPA: VIT1/CCC1 transporter family protein, partial [Thermoanaerobaculia bacterium]|nr:VIT1/CCC1 transporter family protein [Thermoanaerobaculia bacterium]
VAGIGSAMAGTIAMAAGTYLGSRAATQLEEGELEMELAELMHREHVWREMRRVHVLATKQEAPSLARTALL